MSDPKREGKSPTDESARQTPRGVIRAGNLAHARVTPEQLRAAEVAQTGAVEQMGSMETAVGVHAGSMPPITGAQTRAETSDSHLNRVTDQAESMIGIVLAGRYQVIRKIGQGGMGAVYEATHLAIGKRVAVKVLLEKFAKREAIIARLEQEARLATSIGHEHIIDINDFGQTEDGQTFVVMELLEGESLAECLHREHQLPEVRILTIAAQAASALAAAHGKGVIHRDVKPENLFLMKRKDEDFVKVVDFGISKSLRSSDPDVEQSPRLTQTGMVLGTPLYMSPEQARGDDEVDAGVDIYALGVIMFEAGTGRVPFMGSNYLSVISQVLSEEAPVPRSLRPELSEEFEAIVLRAMAKNRSDRYGSAGDMLADIQALLGDPSRSTERARITAPKRAAGASTTNIEKSSGGTKYLIWAAAIAVLIGAVAFTVSVTMGGSKAKPVVAITPLDAPPAKPDAPPAKPDAPPPARAYKLRILSIPPGAGIYEGGRINGITPADVDVAIDTKEVISMELRLEGYSDTPFKIRPGIDQGSITIELKKLKPGTRPTSIKTVAPPPDTTGSGKRPAGNGELGGFPAPLGSKK